MRSLVWIPALTLVFGLAYQASAGDECGQSTAAGVYGVRTEGFSDFVPGPNPSNITDFVPIRSVGRVVLLRNGSLSGAEWANVGGLVFPFTYSGTFTVDSDCTGRLTRNLSIGGPAEEARFVVTSNGKRIFLMGTFPGGRSFSGDLEQISSE